MGALDSYVIPGATNASSGGGSNPAPAPAATPAAPTSALSAYQIPSTSAPLAVPTAPVAAAVAPSATYGSDGQLIGDNPSALPASERATDIADTTAQFNAQAKEANSVWGMTKNFFSGAATQLSDLSLSTAKSVGDILGGLESAGDLVLNGADKLADKITGQAYMPNSPQITDFTDNLYDQTEKTLGVDTNSFAHGVMSNVGAAIPWIAGGEAVKGLSEAGKLAPLVANLGFSAVQATLVASNDYKESKTAGEDDNTAALKAVGVFAAVMGVNALTHSLSGILGKGAATSTASFADSMTNWLKSGLIETANMGGAQTVISNVSQGRAPLENVRSNLLSTAPAMFAFAALGEAGNHDAAVQADAKTTSFLKVAAENGLTQDSAVKGMQAITGNNDPKAQTYVNNVIQKNPDLISKFAENQAVFDKAQTEENAQAARAHLDNGKTPDQAALTLSKTMSASDATKAVEAAKLMPSKAAPAAEEAPITTPAVEQTSAVPADVSIHSKPAELQDHFTDQDKQFADSNKDLKSQAFDLQQKIDAAEKGSNEKKQAKIEFEKVRGQIKDAETSHQSDMVGKIKDIHAEIEEFANKNHEGTKIPKEDMKALVARTMEFATDPAHRDIFRNTKISDIARGVFTDYTEAHKGQAAGAGSAPEKAPAEKDAIGQRLDAVKKDIRDSYKESQESKVRGRAEQGAKESKADSMKVSSIERKLRDNTTTKEKDNARQYLESNHTGKDVRVNDQEGKLTGRASFGRHEVQFEDGTKKFVEGKDIKGDKITDQDVRDHLKEQGMKELSGQETMRRLTPTKSEDSSQAKEESKPTSKSSKRAVQTEDKKTLENKGGKDKSAKSSKISDDKTIPKELKPLAKEAKKYNSPDGFKSELYRFDSLATGAKYVRAGNFDQFPRLSDSDEKITIYRGAHPESNKITAGDWITLDEKSAKEYSANLVKTEVPKSDIVDPGREKGEYIYAPKKLQTNAEDFYNKATGKEESIKNKGETKEVVNTQKESVNKTASAEEARKLAVGDQKISTTQGRKAAISAPIESEGKVVDSRSAVLAKIADQIGDNEAQNLKENTQHNVVNAKKDAIKSLDFVEQYPDRADRIVKGLENPPEGISTTNIKYAVAQKALAEGDIATASRALESDILSGTRNAQELALRRGRTNPNDPATWLQKAMAARVDNANKTNILYDIARGDGAKIVSKTGEDNGGKDRITTEADKAKAKLTRAQIKIEDAQKLVDSLTC